MGYVFLLLYSCLSWYACHECLVLTGLCLQSSVPPLGDDLYAALNDASLSDVMETDVSQMQDLLPLQPYGSVGLLEIADEFEGINGPGQGSIERGTCSTAGPLVHDGKFDEPQMDLGASDCAWYVLVCSLVEVKGRGPEGL